ncbi:arylsulfotransferase family protein [Salinisphaera aquimarina]|uniref:Arylsulfotransferase family protein n=1 Tax=Salinisphaera aquimarina TaxID=2094031 RepID=A0ABV7EQK2_9GAMM
MEKTDRFSFAAFFVACLFLAFIGGTFVVLAKVFPYEYLSDAYKAGTALIAQDSVTDRYTQTDQWRDARTNDRGVTINDTDRAYNGYTLYTGGGSAYASLIDMQGNEVHRWSLPYSKLWDKTPDGRGARPDDLMYWRKAVMYPNGDLLAIYIAAGDTPWGYGMVKLDADSNVIWKYHGATHHDLDIAPDGRVLALTHAFSDKTFSEFPNLAKPFLEDYLVVLNGKTGEEERKIPLFDAFYNSRYQPWLTAIPGFATEDPLHTNSVQFIDPQLASAFAPAGGRPNQALLSFRHPGTAVLVDINSGQITWALKGSWLGQHSARALPNGHFTIFDNYGHFQDHNMTRVLEVDPSDDQIVWRYQGDEQHPFSSRLRGAAATLPNGDRLITESDGGRLFEVAPDGTIVWEFINPVRGGDKDQYIPVVSSGQRIKPAELDPDFRAQLDSK